MSWRCFFWHSWVDSYLGRLSGYSEDYVTQLMYIDKEIARVEKHCALSFLYCFRDEETWFDQISRMVLHRIRYCKRCGRLEVVLWGDGDQITREFDTSLMSTDELLTSDWGTLRDIGRTRRVV